MFVMRECLGGLHVWETYPGRWSENRGEWAIMSLRLGGEVTPALMREHSPPVSFAA